MRIGGVLYLHDITREGSTLNGLTVFSKICGQDAMKWVSIVTTKWERLQDREGGYGKVEELCQGPWGGLIRAGAKVCHLRPADPESVHPPFPEHNEPWEVVSQFFPGVPAYDFGDRILQIQREIVEGGLVIPHTEAGKALPMSINELVKKEKGLKREAKKDFKVGGRRATDLLSTRRENLQKVIAQLDTLNPPGLLALTMRFFL
jgi:hypothetical protein